MSNIPVWVTAIGALFVIVATVAGAISIAWSKATTSRQSLLEANNKTLDDRVQILEDELERERRDHTAEIEKKDLKHAGEIRALTASATALQDKVAVLERVVTGREQLDHITELLIAHDKRVDNFALNQLQHDHDATTRHEDLLAILTANKRTLAEVLKTVQS